VRKKISLTRTRCFSHSLSLTLTLTCRSSFISCFKFLCFPSQHKLHNLSASFRVSLLVGYQISGQTK